MKFLYNEIYVSHANFEEIALKKADTKEAEQAI
jgi:hypothetical protein